MLLLIDGHSLMYRAFYALPLLSNEKGEYTNAVFGFFSMLISAFELLKPHSLAVCFDMHAKTLRQESYEDYKAGRAPMPAELIPQFDMLREILARAGVCVFQQEGLEADDFLGTLSHRAAQNNTDSVILTGDKDCLQLIGKHTKICLTKKGVSEIILFDEDKLYEQYQLTPEQIPHLKGLMGDASDNIPGVAGVGEKTALKLLHEHKTIDGVYENIESVRGKLKEKLEAGRQSAYMSLELATIDINIPVEIDFKLLKMQESFKQSLGEIFVFRGFKTLKERINPNAAEETFAPENKIISNMDELNEATAKIKDKLSVAYEKNEITLCIENIQYSFECAQNLLGDFTWDKVAAGLSGVFENDAVVKLCYDKKGLRTFLKKMNVLNLNNAQYDVMVAMYCIDPTLKSFSLKAIFEKYDLYPSVVSLEELFEKQKKEISQKNLDRIFYEIETPLTDVLFDMEQEGFLVDSEELNRLGGEYFKIISECEQEIYKLAGEKFNVNSPKQLGEILFNKLMLPAEKKTKTGYSTDVEVLEKLADSHPIIEYILRFRQYSKLNSTYIDGIKNLTTGRGRVHTTLNQISTATGRISSTEPNLQNIPMRTDAGREIRKIFCASKDNILICADYSQIELRILAHISNDEHMIDAFKNDYDIHTATAQEVFSVSMDKVTPDMRREAKAVNFGIVYGISDFGLSRNLNVSRKKAHELIEKYLLEFKGVAEYMENIIAKAKQDGYVTTLWGRRRDIKEFASSNYSVRQFGERVALNTPVQGSAADIIKHAMIQVYDSLKEGGYSSKLILQIHDELIIDAKKEEVTAVKHLLAECMEGAADLLVPLKVNVSQGNTWYDAK